MKLLHKRRANLDDEMPLGTIFITHILVYLQPFKVDIIRYVVDQDPEYWIGKASDVVKLLYENEGRRRWIMSSGFRHSHVPPKRWSLSIEVMFKFKL